MPRDSVTFKDMVDFLEPRLDKIDNKIDGIQNQLNNQKLLAAVIGGFAGVISAIINPFKR